MLVLVTVIVPAARAMRVIVRMIVGVIVIVTVRMIVSMRVAVSVLVMRVVVMMTVAVGMIVPVLSMTMMTVVVTAIVFVRAALRLEGAHHRSGRAALSAHQLGKDVVVLDVDRVRGHLGRGMAVAHVVGDLQEPERVLGPDLQERLRRRLDLDEAAILELHGVAVVQGRGFGEIEQEIDPRVAFERDAAAMAALVVERDGVGDAVGLDGEFSDNGGGAQHDRPSEQEVALRHG
jgi:Ca2+/Na+ antiporter